MPLTLLAESTCDICIDEYADGEQAPFVLPCGHPLCRRCLHSLQAPRSCPFCRVRLTWNDGRQLVCEIAPAAPEAALFGTAGLHAALADDDDVPEPDPEPTPKELADRKAERLLRKVQDAFLREAEAGRDGHPENVGQTRLDKFRKFRERREMDGDGMGEYATLESAARMLQAFLDQRAQYAEDLARKQVEWSEYAEKSRMTWMEHTNHYWNEILTLREQVKNLQQRVQDSTPLFPYPYQSSRAPSRTTTPYTHTQSSTPLPLRKFHQVPVNNDHNPMPAPPKLTSRRPSLAQADQAQTRHASMPNINVAVAGPSRVAAAPSRTPSLDRSRPIYAEPAGMSFRSRYPEPAAFDTKPILDAVARIPRPRSPSPATLRHAAPQPPSAFTFQPPPPPPTVSHRALPAELPDVDVDAWATPTRRVSSTSRSNSASLPSPGVSDTDADADDGQPYIWPSRSRAQSPTANTSRSVERSTGYTEPTTMTTRPANRPSRPPPIRMSYDAATDTMTHYKPQQPAPSYARAPGSGYSTYYPPPPPPSVPRTGALGGLWGSLDSDSDAPARY
ncbi:hypothetical protein EXIGLDRAFT_379094 [Exidia glandulosa HHB12029]|uniref:RING-type domain-containing protein n=1 Tax=Exidia glandulosa HHB12029 TaxID=1314781 RepID=A0A165L579_EXIGL|nr:hypothetical protein EXIGLDRAFT_379094 [Exidia glandulosa HHB12029]